MLSVLIETAAKRTFASSADWPGWSRGRPTEAAALEALIAYGPRYAHALARSGVPFAPPGSMDDLCVVERRPGNATTAFGAPGVVMASDWAPLAAEEVERFLAILRAAWLAYGSAVGQSAGHTLRTGPRGGGRDVERMTTHVLDANVAYLSSIGWKHRRADGGEPREEWARLREATLAALGAAARGELPARGPRGGVMWPARFYARRVAWHLLDHAWEIEDRIV